MGETVDFLDWLLQLNFVLLGYREYELFDSEDGRAIRAMAGSGSGSWPTSRRRHFADGDAARLLAPDSATGSRKATCS